ncbi:MAG: lytic transglycosylase domain-containing protein [Bacillota bacterium]
MAYLYNIVPVWLYPVEYSEIIVEEADNYDIDPLLVCAMIKSESNYDPDAVSAVGAVGLMQLMPDTASWLAEKHSIEYDESMLYAADYNIRLGCLYLDTLLEYWDGNIVEAVASYNGGHANVEKWVSNGTWDGTEEDIGSIPFAETRTYTQKVMDCYDNYINLYGDDIRFAGFR